MSAEADAVMPGKRIWPAVLPVLLAAGAAAADFKSLVGAERAFAALSAEKGIRTAFLANLAADSVVFRPGPVSGRAAYESRGEIPGRLTWRPEFADISRAGDLGYTTGPYEMRTSGATGELKSCGHYFSVWRLEPQGVWKVVLDAGVPHPCPAVESGEADVARPNAPGAPGPSAEPGPSKDRILGVDRALAAEAAKTGRPDAWLDAWDTGVRVYRPSMEPVLGLAEALKLSAPAPGRWTWAPADGGISRSGDFGFTYGTLAVGGANFVYVRVWKKSERSWKAVLEVLNPLPAKPGT